MVVVGAASKGIIQRAHQHSAAVYRTPLAQNPFGRVTDEELEEYRSTVERASRRRSGEAAGGREASGMGEENECGFT